MTTVHHRYATVDGRRLFYREAGPGGAPTVVPLLGKDLDAIADKLIERYAAGAAVS